MALTSVYLSVWARTDLIKAPLFIEAKCKDFLKNPAGTPLQIYEDAILETLRAVHREIRDNKSGGSLSQLVKHIRDLLKLEIEKIENPQARTLIHQLIEKIDARKYENTGVGIVLLLAQTPGSDNLFATGAWGRPDTWHLVIPRYRQDVGGMFYDSAIRDVMNDPRGHSLSEVYENIERTISAYTNAAENEIDRALFRDLRARITSRRPGSMDQLRELLNQRNGAPIVTRSLDSNTWEFIVPREALRTPEKYFRLAILQVLRDLNWKLYDYSQREQIDLVRSDLNYFLAFAPPEARTKIEHVLSQLESRSFRSDLLDAINNDQGKPVAKGKLGDPRSWHLVYE